jgi:hypothetical protein
MLACAGVIAVPVKVKWVAVILGIMWMWHIVAIPICVLYLIGKPVVMSLSPLIPSSQSRALARQLRDRPDLSDEEFYTRFYEGSGIPREIPARVRRSLLEIDSRINRVIPADCVAVLYDDLDFADIVSDILKEFGIRFDYSDCESIDGTLDNLIRLVHRRISP